jgi:hypothetical protein
MAKILACGLAMMVAGTAWAQQEPDFGAMMKALTGAAQSPQSTNAPATVSPKALKESLPKTVPGFERVEAGAEKQGAFGMNTVIATGVYESGEKSIRIEITDVGGMGGLGAMAMMGWASSEVDKETRSGFERTTTYQGFKALESFDRESQSGEIQVFDGGRYSVKIEGSDLGSFEELVSAVNAMDLKALSALKPEAAPAP